MLKNKVNAGKRVVSDSKKKTSKLSWFDWFKGGIAITVLAGLSGWGVVYTVQQANVNAPMQAMTMLLGVTAIAGCLDQVVKLIRK